MLGVECHDQLLMIRICPRPLISILPVAWFPNVGGGPETVHENITFVFVGNVELFMVPCMATPPKSREHPDATAVPPPRFSIGTTHTPPAAEAVHVVGPVILTGW